MRLIDAEQRVSVTIYDEEHEEHLVKTMTVEKMLDTYANEGCPAPTIDAVLVVRCKDCKYYVPDGDGVPGGGCTMTYSYMPEDGYCSDGERKEDNETD